MPNEAYPKKQSKLGAWFSGPYRPGLTKPAMWLIIAMAICAVWANNGMDNDSYYMIPQGQEILASGIPEFNTYTYHGARTVVQQWLYCISMYLSDSLAGNIGLMAFMLIQALALFWLMERYLRKAVGDPFWSWLAATGILSTCSLTYFTSLRPENITLILMLLQCMALERYRDTKHKRYLAALPAIMLAEANLHISMWPIHACIYAAYLVPAIFPWLQKKAKLAEKTGLDICPGYLKKDWPDPDPALYTAAAASMLMLFLNPYGLDGVMYLFRSMPVFSVIAMSEQQPPTMISTLALLNIILFISLWILLKNKKIGAVEACMAVGLTALACTNYHNSMFLAIAAANLVRPAFRALSEKDPAKAADLMPNGLKTIVCTGLAIAACVTAMITVPNIQDFKDKPGMDPMIEYVANNKRQSGNILNNMNAGPMLEYAGVRGLYGDTRPELLLDSIGKTGENPCLVLAWLCSGYMPEEIEESYGSIETYLDEHDIQYIIDEDTSPVMTWLDGWLTASGDWEKISFESALLAEEDGLGEAYCVWQRK